MLDLRGGMPRGASRTPRGQNEMDKVEKLQLVKDELQSHENNLTAHQLPNVMNDTVNAIRQKLTIAERNPDAAVNQLVMGMPLPVLKGLKATTSNKNLPFKVKALSKHMFQQNIQSSKILELRAKECNTACEAAAMVLFTMNYYKDTNYDHDAYTKDVDDAIDNYNRNLGLAEGRRQAEAEAARRAVEETARDVNMTDRG